MLKRLSGVRNRGSHDGEGGHQHDQENERREASQKPDNVDLVRAGAAEGSLRSMFPSVSLPFSKMHSWQNSFVARYQGLFCSRPLSRAQSHHRHQDLLIGILALDLAGDAAFAHRDDAIADRKHLRQF